MATARTARATIQTRLHARRVPRAAVVRALPAARRRHTRTGALRAARDGGAAHEPQGARGGRVARRVRGALERQAAAPDGLCFYGSAGKQLLGDPTLPCPPRRGPRRIVSSPTWCARRSGRSATPSRACCPTTRPLVLAAREWAKACPKGNLPTRLARAAEQAQRELLAPVVRRAHNVSYWLPLCAMCLCLQGRPNEGAGCAGGGELRWPLSFRRVQVWQLRDEPARLRGR